MLCLVLFLLTYINVAFNVWRTQAFVFVLWFLNRVLVGLHHFHNVRLLMLTEGISTVVCASETGFDVKIALLLMLCLHSVLGSLSIHPEYTVLYVSPCDNGQRSSVLCNVQHKDFYLISLCY